MSKYKEPIIGDVVLCISNKPAWCEKYTIGNKYEILRSEEGSFMLKDDTKRELWHRFEHEGFAPSSKLTINEVLENVF